MEFLRDFLGRSLERKFAFFMVAMVAIAMVSVATVTTAGIRRSVTESFQRRVSTQLAYATAAVEGPPGSFDLERARRLLSASYADPELAAIVAVPQADTEKPIVLVGTLPAGVEITRELALKPAPLLLYPAGGGDNFVGWSARSSKGWILVIYSKARTEAFVRETNGRLLEVASIVGILSCLLGLFMARLILRPIESFIAAMKLIAEGQEIAQLTTLDKNELGEWTRTFNLMIEQLRRKHNLEMYVLHREKSELVTHIAAGLAHRIRTPLTAINSLTQLITMGGKEQKLKEWTGVILEKVRELDEAVSHFVTWARPVPLQFRPAKVSETLGFALDILQPDLAAAQVTLERSFRLDNELPQLHDTQQLQQALIHLVRHASTVSPKGSTVSVSLMFREGTQGAVITIQDAGEPVPADMRARLFEPFGDSTSRYGGIGLSVAARLIEMHGGDIFHHSPAEGGNSYVVTLPSLTAQELEMRVPKE